MALRGRLQAFFNSTFSRILPYQHRVGYSTTVRHNSQDTAEALKTVIVSKAENGVATLSLNRPPVNAFSLDMLLETRHAVDQLQSDASVKGIIVASALPKVFSAGMDLTEFRQDAGRVRQFWRALQDMWCSLYGCTLPMVAAVNGPAPAGGCLVALACDYRVMVETKANIGLIEVHVGIPVPPWLIDTMVNTIGQGPAEKALILGQMYSPQEALRLGVVDRLVAKETLLDACNEQMDTYLQVPATPLRLTKSYLRKVALDRFNDNKEKYLDQQMEILTGAAFQNQLTAHQQTIKK